VSTYFSSDDHTSSVEVCFWVHVYTRTSSAKVKHMPVIRYQVLLLRVGPNREYSINWTIIHNPFSSSFARRSAFSKFQDNLEISFMDTNGNLGIMSHVRHLRRTPTLSQENELRKVLLVIVKFHKMSKTSHQMSLRSQEKFAQIFLLCIVVVYCSCVMDNNRQQYTASIHNYNTQLQYTTTIHIITTQLQYTTTIHNYNTHYIYIHVYIYICIYKLQYTTTIHNYNT